MTIYFSRPKRCKRQRDTSALPRERSRVIKTRKYNMLHYYNLGFIAKDTYPRRLCIRACGAYVMIPNRQPSTYAFMRNMDGENR